MKIEIEHIVIGAVWRCTLDTERREVQIASRTCDGSEATIAIPWCDHSPYYPERSHLMATGSTYGAQAELHAVQVKLRAALHDATTN